MQHTATPMPCRQLTCPRCEQRHLWLPFAKSLHLSTLEMQRGHDVNSFDHFQAYIAPVSLKLIVVVAGTQVVAPSTVQGLPAVILNPGGATSPVCPVASIALTKVWQVA